MQLNIVFLCFLLIGFTAAATAAFDFGAAHPDSLVLRDELAAAVQTLMGHEYINNAEDDPDDADDQNNKKGKRGKRIGKLKNKLKNKLKGKGKKKDDAEDGNGD